MSDTKPFISTYDAVYSILESSGGDMTKNYDSVYSMVVELIRLIKGEEETVSSPQTYSLRKTMSLLADAGIEYPFDFTNAGYSQEESDELNREILSVYQADIDYSKTLYDAWEPSNTSTVALYGNDKKLVYAPNIDTSNVTDMHNMFYQCSLLTTIPPLNTSKVTDTNWMFYGCSSLTTIPQLDTSKVTNMNSMFNSCSSLISIPLLDTSKVTNMSNMFSGCSSLTTIPQIDISNVTSMSSMFDRCSSLTTIPQLDTSKVTNMYSMFSSCSSLISIPLLDTSKVTTMNTIFGYGNLNNLTDLGGFKDLKISITSSFLDKCPKLTVDSLMNVINNLYDLTVNGLSGQTLKFGTTNLNKLTTEQIAIATNKGWTLT